jgi:hypothetical protein
VKFLLDVPYTSLPEAAKSCHMFSDIIKTPEFWYKKTCLELKREVDIKEFENDPRLRYVRILGLNHIFHPGFEVYFSPFEIAMRAAEKKNEILLNYIVAYIIQNKTLSRPDWLAINLAYLDYTLEGYHMIVAMDLQVATLVPFFLDALNPAGPKISKEMLNELLKIQSRHHSPETAERMRRNGDLCLKIAQHLETVEELAEFPEHIFYKTAIKYKRYDLVPRSGDVFYDLRNDEDWATIEKFAREGKLDLSKFPDPFNFLYYQDSSLSLFPLVFQHFDGTINSEDKRRNLFGYKCFHDLVGFDMILSKLPKERIRKYMKYIPEECKLAAILCENRIQ